MKQCTCREEDSVMQVWIIRYSAIPKKEYNEEKETFNKLPSQ